MGGLQTAITLVTAVSSFALMLLPRRKWNQPLQLLHWLHVNLATPINILWDWFPFKDQLVSIKTPDLNSLLCLFSVPQLLVASLDSLWKWKSPNSRHFFAKNSTDSTSCLFSSLPAMWGQTSQVAFCVHGGECRGGYEVGQIFILTTLSPGPFRKTIPRLTPNRSISPTDLVQMAPVQSDLTSEHLYCGD